MIYNTYVTSRTRQQTRGQKLVSSELQLLINNYDYMTEARKQKIENRIQYIMDNPQEFKNPDLMLEGLNTLLINWD